MKPKMGKRERLAKAGLKQLLCQEFGLGDSEACRRAAQFLDAERLPDGRYVVDRQGMTYLGKYLRRSVDGGVELPGAKTRSGSK